MKILVTGATGFIGGAVVNRLVSESLDVRVLLRNSKDKCKLNGTKSVIGDLRNYASIKKALRGIDVVVNCAGALPFHKLKDDEYWDINAKGTKNIVDSCLENKVKKLIHISTIGIFNKRKDAYTLSKLEAEKIITNSRLNKKTVIFRPTICYGPGDLRPVFLRLFKMIKIRLNISIGAGRNYFHTIFIDNLVDIITKSIFLDNVLGNDFNVGDLKCPKMKDITNSIIKSYGKRCVTIVVPLKIALVLSKILGNERTVRFVSEDLKYNMDKLKKYFKIKSDMGIEEGIKKTFDWYVSNKLI